jgi:hypothetical protein
MLSGILVLFAGHSAVHGKKSFFIISEIKNDYYTTPSCLLEVTTSY